MFKLPILRVAHVSKSICRKEYHAKILRKIDKCTTMIKISKRRLLGDPRIAERYTNVVEKYFVDGHARLPAPADLEGKGLVFATHFGINSNKPKKIRALCARTVKYQVVSLNDYLI